MGIKFLHLYLIQSNWLCGKDGGLETWRPCRVASSNPTVNKMFCNVYLFRVPQSWTGSIQMKSSMTFIRGNRCIEREKYVFKNSRECKCFKECALAVTTFLLHFISFALAHLTCDERKPRITK